MARHQRPGRLLLATRLLRGFGHRLLGHGLLGYRLLGCGLLGLALFGLGACGGGAAAQPPPAPPVETVDFGLLSSTAPTPLDLDLGNPLPEAATVTLVSAVGPFAPDASAFPLILAPGDLQSVPVVFTPDATGPVTGTVVVAYAGATRSGQATYELKGTAETLSIFVFTPTLDFGVVTVGEQAERTLSFRNASALSTVTFRSASLPAGGFQVVGAPFPLTLAPGRTGDLTFRYAPASQGVHDGTLTVGPADPGAFTVAVRASASTHGEQIVTDYGTQSLDGSGRTATLEVQVPSDAISLSLEGWGATSDVIGLDTLTGPGSKTYENAASTGSYIWAPGFEIFTTTVPNTDRTNVQLVPGGGTYTFSLRLLQGSSSTLRVRAIVERRSAAAASTGVLDLNVFLAQALTPTASTAASDTRLQAILAQIGSILGQSGIQLGQVSYFDVTDATYDDVTYAEFPQMLATWTAGASAERLNLFFVRTAIGGGVVGVSATIAGPQRNGTTASGVMSVYDGYSVATVGLIAAHELGHYLGLYHTVEQDGSHDFIDDTLECPATGTNATCTTTGGGYLMHWQAVGGSTLTSAQGRVIRGHPHLAPLPPGSGSTKPASAPPFVLEAGELPRGWCGTCDQVLRRKP
jgi:hypothetical protein